MEVQRRHDRKNPAKKMTQHDESSIYVGGIPFDITEDTLRRVFDPYGDVVAVKIVNDRGKKGKCFAFVTFRNPRSAVNAIDDMDGRSIGGRVVRVNEVKTRGVRPGFEREGFHRGSERGRDWERERGRERDYDHNRERFRDRSGDRSRDWEGSREYDFERERGIDRVYDRERATDDGLWDGDRDRDGDLEDGDRDRSRERDPGSDSDRDREFDRNTTHRTTKMDKHNISRKYNGSVSTNRRSREILSDSNNGYGEQLKEQLKTSTGRLEELRKEVSLAEVKLEESGSLISELQQKSKELEELLISAKKTSLQHKTQLTNLHKCFLQARDSAERAKISEKELQSLVDEATSVVTESL